MKGAESFRLLVFVESSVFVFPVFMGLFDSWSPSRGRRVRGMRLFGFAFVEEFIEEVLHVRCGVGWIARIDAEGIYLGQRITWYGWTCSSLAM